MVPIDDLGKRYILGGYDNSLQRVVKVVALNKNQTFYIDSRKYTNSYERQVHTHECRFSCGLTKIVSDEPMMVVVLVASSTSKDVAMMLPVARNEWSSSYQVFFS
ncbi:hypothetical protein ACOMHN_058098 [Nucella lapillus]